MVSNAKAIIVKGMLVTMLACDGGGGASQGGKDDMGKDLSFEDASDVPEVISDARDSASVEEAQDVPEAIGDARDNAGDESQAPDTVETATYLCRPCIENEDCAPAGSPGELDCIAIGNTGKFCLPRCDNCPAGYTCSRGGFDHCLPQSGQCECTDEFINGGYETVCYLENGFGRCEGRTKCTENGFAPCSAKTPAPEECNGVDDDCDGQTDEEGAIGCEVYYQDTDADGFGVDTDKKCLCVPMPPYNALVGGDCNDSDRNVYPGATESCNQNDDDCDGSVDEENAVGCLVYYFDGDSDGYGVTSNSRCLCVQEGKYTTLLPGDCDDSNPAISPGAVEQCANLIDDNCNGQVDELGCQGCITYYKDEDQDGYGVTGDTECLSEPLAPYTATNGGDCDDSDGNINPGSWERCDQKDNDCDGQTDEENAVGCLVYYRDFDGDNYGTAYHRCLCAPDPETGFTATQSGDCNDNDASINPSAIEKCNNTDDNCDGHIDDEGAQGCTIYYYDGDHDTFGVTGDTRCLCSPSGKYTATSGGDCNDTDPSVNPGAIEKCNGKDDDCDHLTDEERTSGQCEIDGYTLYYYDGDGDAYGVTGNTKCLCSPSGKYTATSGGDCNDTDPSVNPGAIEKCNGKDDDCDQQTDEERTSGPCWGDGYTLYHYDGDGDAWGTGDTKCLCSPSGEYTAPMGGDCDDSDPRVHHGGSVCGIDADCDGSLLDPGEECDDGNTNTADGCANCAFVEFQVNTWTTNTQWFPSIASLPKDGFVVVWTSGCGPDLGFACSASPEDGSELGVYGQRFDSNGNKIGSEFQVNTWTTNSQHVPSITSLSNGGFVVVWQSNWQDGSGWGVYGQMFDSNGNKVGSEFQVNTWTTDDQSNPSITSLPNGGVVVVWNSWGQDGSEDGVYGQRFDSNGNKVGSEFQVNTWTTYDQWVPSITSLPNGGFVVVWESGCWWEGCNPQDGSGYGVYGQMFDSNGNKIGSEFQVNTWTTDWQGLPSITSLPNGGFVVVWESGCWWEGYNPQDGSAYGVYGQRFDSNGDKIGSEFQVNTWTTDYQSFPSISSLPGGGFVVVWESLWQDGSGYGVYGQRFDSDGNKVGSEFQVNTWTTNDQWHPSITSLPNGGFVVVWSSRWQDDSDYGVYGRIFSQ